MAEALVDSWNEALGQALERGEEEVLPLGAVGEGVGRFALTETLGEVPREGVGEALGKGERETLAQLLGVRWEEGERVKEGVAVVDRVAPYMPESVGRGEGEGARVEADQLPAASTAPEEAVGASADAEPVKDGRGAEGLGVLLPPPPPVPVAAGLAVASWGV